MKCYHGCVLKYHLLKCKLQQFRARHIPSCSAVPAQDSKLLRDQSNKLHGALTRLAISVDLLSQVRQKKSAFLFHLWTRLELICTDPCFHMAKGRTSWHFSGKLSRVSCTIKYTQCLMDSFKLKLWVYMQDVPWVSEFSVSLGYRNSLLAFPFYYS